MNIPKILIGAPIYSGMEYCFNEFIEAVKSINYSNYDILLVDNSKTKDYFNELKKIEGIKVIYDTTKDEKNLFRLISSRNKILKYAEKNNYDYLLMLDADVIPPKEILNELLKCKKDIVSGLYLRFVNEKWEANADRKITEEELSSLKKEGRISTKVNDTNGILRSLTNEDVNSGKLFEVEIASGGCLLLNRGAFSRIKYGYLGYGLDDNYFFEKAKEKGFKVYCYPKVFCEHRIGIMKFKDGRHHLEG